MLPPGDDYSKQHAGAGYPPPMPGYTPSYPGYPPQYQGYPPGPGYHGYPPSYTQAPPAVYYSQQQQQYAPAPEPRPAHRCIRCCLTMVIVLLLGSFAMSILTWIIFGEDVPEFHVESMSVPEFNVTTGSIKASWDANITVTNMNHKARLTFDELEGVVEYGSRKLAYNKSRVDPFSVDPNGRKSFNIKFVAVRSQQQDTEWVNYRGLVDDRNTSHVNFDITMVANATLHSDLWPRYVTLMVHCMNLMVRFSGPTGPGYLVAGREGNRECISYEL